MSDRDSQAEGAVSVQVPKWEHSQHVQESVTRAEWVKGRENEAWELVGPDHVLKDRCEHKIEVVWFMVEKITLAACGQ